MKGQYFSFDAIIGAVIFVMALVALLSYWHSVKAYLDYQNDVLSRDAVRISNLLFTPAVPSSDCATMSRLGFSFSWDDRRVDKNVIDCAKTRAGADPNWLRSVLGTQYNVSITVTTVQDKPLVWQIGQEAPASAAENVKMRRLATVVDGKDSYLARIDLSLYR